MTIPPRPQFGCGKRQPNDFLIVYTAFFFFFSNQ